MAKAPQTEAFLKGEGDAWHRRNLEKPRLNVVLPAIMSLGLHPKIIVEFGCGNGWLLDEISNYLPDAYLLGLDPSQEAIDEAHDLYGTNKVHFMRGTADFPAIKNCDLIIYGFCLYLVDRCVLQRVVYEADSMLREGGHIIIHDFNPSSPHKVPYHHLDGIFSYKMDHSQLWLGNPAYSLVAKTSPDADTAVWVLKKDTTAGWP